MYECKLVNDGCIKLVLCRTGKSHKEILKALKCYQWSKGDWVITKVKVLRGGR